MKAISIAKNGGPEVLELVNLPKPIAQKGQLLVKNSFAGVNFIDTYHRSGLYPTTLPLVLGREGAGVVEAVGPDVSGFKVGDRVAYFNQGSYAEYTCVSPEKTAVIPDAVSFQEGSVSIVAGLTALMLVRKVYQVKKDDTVLVHAAAGGVGQLLCQLCKYFGARVIGTTSTEQKATIAKEAGADEVILYSKQNVLEQVKQLTDGKGVDIVYDGVGKSTFDDSLASCKRRGWLVCFGNASGKPEPLDILRLTKQGSVTLARPTLFDYIDTEENFRAMMSELLTLMEKRIVKFQIDHIFPLSEARKSHEALEGRVTTGKVILDCEK